MAQDGYDYVGDGASPVLLLFLRAEDPGAAVESVVNVLNSERVLENDLSAFPVAIEDGNGFRVVHPPDFQGVFRRPVGW